jgi:hypothetical protein
MKRTILAFIAVCILAPSIIAEGEETALPMTENRDKRESPQIAYSLFSNWADNYQASAKKRKCVAEGILFGSSAAFAGGAALTWFAGDSMSESSNGSPMDPEEKKDLTMGLGIASGALLVSGIIVAAVPIKDYRAIYADVFQEKDPEVREAMAVSVLRYQADRGKEGRIASFIWGCALPVFVGGIAICANLSEGDDWNKGVLSSMGGSSWSMAGGVVALFTKSPEERLYKRYLDARDAYYGTSR